MPHFASVITLAKWRYPFENSASLENCPRTLPRAGTVLRIPPAALAKLPPHPPQGRDFPLKPRHHLQNCSRNCPAAKWHGSTPPGRGGGAHRLRDGRPANSSAGTDPHQGRDRTGAAPIGAGNRSLGQAIRLPQCAVPYPNAVHWAREGAPAPVEPQSTGCLPLKRRQGRPRPRVGTLPRPPNPPRPQTPRSSDIHHLIPPDLRHASQKDYMSLVSMARYSPCPSRKNSTPR
mgnify:CR=1 FL=1